jgi:hypothetical protein
MGYVCKVQLPYILSYKSRNFEHYLMNSTYTRVIIFFCLNAIFLKTILYFRNFEPFWANIFSIQLTRVYTVLLIKVRGTINCRRFTRYHISMNPQGIFFPA